MSVVELRVAPHPLLHLRAFSALWPAPLAELPAVPELTDLLQDGGGAPVERSEELRVAVRRLLRHGGYKPTGRGKPSSEYLVRAAGEGALGSINPAVDLGNGVSLASGVPISVVDLDRVRGALRVAIAEEGARYVFNPAGQEIDVGGLLCLWDEEGPTANAVKDAQRTKTTPESRHTLTLLWGPLDHADHAERTEAWARELAQRAGAEVRPANLVPAEGGAQTA